MLLDNNKIEKVVAGNWTSKSLTVLKWTGVAVGSFVITDLLVALGCTGASVALHDLLVKQKISKETESKIRGHVLSICDIATFGQLLDYDSRDRSRYKMWTRK